MIAPLLSATANEEVHTTLEQTSEILLVVSMVVLVVSMLAYTADLAAASERFSWGKWAELLAGVGTLTLVATVATRGLAVSRVPLANMYEFAIVGAMFVMVIFSGWSAIRDIRWLGLFVVGPALLTLGLASAVWWTGASPLLPSLQSTWLPIHVTVATLAIAVFTIAFSLTVMHLLASRAEASAKATSPVWRRLPTADRLDRLAYSLHIIAFPLWTFTLIAGAIWAEHAWGRYWGWDPKEVWTFVIWVVYAAYLHARATTGWSTQRASWVAVAGFACIILNYTVVNVFFVGFHSYSGM